MFCDIVDASPNGIELGIRDEKLICGWRKVEGDGSSNHSTSLIDRKWLIVPGSQKIFLPNKKTTIQRVDTVE